MQPRVSTRIPGTNVASGVMAAILMTLIASSVATAADWANWRGPEGYGLSRETDLPGEWSPGGEGHAAKNLLWTKPYGARSGLVSLLGRVYTLNLAGSDERRQERVMCIDAKSGNVIWEHRFNVFLTDIPDRRVGWSKPAVDPTSGYVYAHGVQGTFLCLDRDGKVIWERSLTEEFGRISGYGGRTHTPVIAGDLVILSFLNSSWGPQGKGAHRYVAFDKKSGLVVWWSTPGGRPLDTTYSCPVVAVVNDQELLIAGNADGGIYAMRLQTGELVWKFMLSKRGLNSSVAFRDGLVYACHSEENVDKTVMGRVVCIDASGTGDITKTHEKWRVDGVTAGYATPALDDKNIYVVDNSANIRAYDRKTGAAKWHHNVGTVMKASPIVGDNKIYIGSANGVFTVVEMGSDGPKTISKHEFLTPDGRIVEINGTACISDGRVFFATTQAMYAIGAADWKGKSQPVPPVKKVSSVDPSSAPAKLLLYPADVTLHPAQSRAFEGRLYDAKGRFIKSCKPALSVKGLAAKVEDQTVGVPAGASFAAGRVSASFAGVTGTARLRVVPKLPFRVDFESITDGKSPAGWISATPVKFGVEVKDGSKAFSKLGDKPRFLLANCYFGWSTWSDYTLQADVLGTEKRRQMPNIGILANRYNLSLMGNTQRARIVSWAPMPRVEEKVKFKWNPNVWYRMKLRVDRQGKEALVRGKVWPRDEDEPKEWTVTLRDPSPNFFGSPGLHGYSAGATDRSPGTKIYWDNIVVTPND
ncbi:MAG: PQQ-binding-like beta-propeller repeat protein [Planctomycetota bacterium]